MSPTPQHRVALITDITGQDYLAEFPLNKGYEVHGNYNLLLCPLWRSVAPPGQHTARLRDFE